MNASVDLLQIARAGRPFRFGPGVVDGRKQQGSQNGNDGDDHQQFQQREGAFDMAIDGNWTNARAVRYEATPDLIFNRSLF